MIDARLNPVFLKNKGRSAKLQFSGSPLKTQVTYARATSYRPACLTMWQGTKPTWQQLIPSVTQIAVSFPYTINCILWRRTTMSSSNTLPHISCSLHKQPWQLISVPTTSMGMLSRWIGSVAFA